MFLPSSPDLSDIAQFLSDRFGSSVRNVAPLGAGLWSRAYSFDVGDLGLVLRLGNYDEDFAKDRIAASWDAHDLPVPEFLGMGEAFDTFYAITQRAHGTFLDHLNRDEVVEVLPSLFEILDALRRVPVAKNARFGLWDRNGVGQHGSWAQALLAIAEERPRRTGWKLQMQQSPECESVFDEGFARLQAMVERVPSRQDIIHSDLLNRNVLVTDGKVTSVFDWGCAMYGDHLYDVAWLAFCEPWTKGFDRQEVLQFARKRFVDEGWDAGDFDHRIATYELHITLDVLSSNAFLTNRDGVQLEQFASKIL